MNFIGSFQLFSPKKVVGKTKASLHFKTEGLKKNTITYELKITTKSPSKGKNKL